MSMEETALNLVPILDLGADFPASRAENQQRDPDPVDPDYRFARAVQLKSANCYFDQAQDPLVMELLTIFKMQQLLPVEDLQYLHDMCSSVYGALAVRQAKHDLRGLYIECGVLADASIEEIAAFVGLPQDVVEAYEKVFFDMRGRMQVRGYVQGRLFHSVASAVLERTGGMNPNSAQANSDDVCRLLALFFGWESFQQYVASYEFTTEAAWVLRNLIAKNEATKMLNASFKEPVGLENAPEILGRGQQRAGGFQRLEEQTREMSQGAPDWRQRLEEILEVKPAAVDVEFSEGESCPLLEEGQAEQQDEPSSDATVPETKSDSS